MPTPTVVAALTLALAGGCSTTYQPRPDARVGLVVRHGGAFYVKDGALTPVGPFSGDLESLVGADTPSGRLARRARRELEVGVPLYVLGVAGAVVGAAALSGGARWPVVGAGAVGAGAGLSLIGAGFTNAVDAVNVHNDAHNDAVGAR